MANNRNRSPICWHHVREDKLDFTFKHSTTHFTSPRLQGSNKPRTKPKLDPPSKSNRHHLHGIWSKHGKEITFLRIYICSGRHKTCYRAQRELEVSDSVNSSQQPDMHQPVPAIFLRLVLPSAPMISMLDICCSQVRESWTQCSSAGPSTTYSNGIVETGATEEQRYGESSGNQTRRGYKIMLGIYSRRINKSELDRSPPQRPATGHRARETTEACLKENHFVL